VVCGSMQPREELVRLAKKDTGDILYDEQGNSGGKGIYVGKNVKCLDEFTREKKFRRRFHSRLAPEALHQLKELSENLKNR
jgi:predicted RNA-binding protein YlxR (DUF448 family)